MERRMISHVTIGVNDLKKSIQFYDEILSTISLSRHSTGDSYAGYGEANETGRNSLWILHPINGQSATGGNGTNIALLAPDRSSVDNFHAKAIELGATDDGKPGIRADAHENFYAAYIIDYDGNKLLAVCHNSQK
jgi:catechol 2,3-dioxygenase-like lactoylglutathione lyase family enzyme